MSLNSFILYREQERKEDIICGIRHEKYVWTESEEKFANRVIKKLGITDDVLTMQFFQNKNLEIYKVLVVFKQTEV